MLSNLNSRLDKAGLSKAQIARKSGLSESTIGRSARGRIDTPRTLYRIFNAFNELAPQAHQLQSIQQLFPDFDGD